MHSIASRTASTKPLVLQSHDEQVGLYRENSTYLDLEALKPPTHRALTHPNFNHRLTYQCMRDASQIGILGFSSGVILSTAGLYFLILATGLNNQDLINLSLDTICIGAKVFASSTTLIALHRITDIALMCSSTTGSSQ